MLGPSLLDLKSSWLSHWCPPVNELHQTEPSWEKRQSGDNLGSNNSFLSKRWWERLLEILNSKTRSNAKISFFDRNLWNEFFSDVRCFTQRWVYRWKKTSGTLLLILLWRFHKSTLCLKSCLKLTLFGPNWGWYFKTLRIRKWVLILVSLRILYSQPEILKMPLKRGYIKSALSLYEATLIPWA